MRSIISAGEQAPLGRKTSACTGAIEGVDSAGDDHCGQAGLQLLGATNQFVAVHLRHQEIAEQQIE